MNRTLKVLNLSSCGLDTAVATHIAAGLAQNVLHYNVSASATDPSITRLL